MDKPENEMTFLDHLEALRWHLIRSAAFIVTAAVIWFIYPEVLFDRIILGPLQPDFISYRAFCRFSHWAGAGDAMCIDLKSFDSLQNLSVGGVFISHLWISFMAGLIVSVPYLLWELWRFVKPALKEKELKMARGFVFYASFLFFAGIFFSYFMVTPLSVNFLLDYQISDRIKTVPTLDNYISFVTTMVFAIGLVFELPVLVYLLTKIGMMSPGFMRKYRRHAIVVILIIAAIITPSPDISSQLLVAFPLYILYELSIHVSKYVVKNQKDRA
ncbi:MAG: twin-arginine translocase subunit TatC [Bacteroidota bacterium]